MPTNFKQREDIPISVYYLFLSFSIYSVTLVVTVDTFDSCRQLFKMNLSGTLAPEVGLLSQLKTL